MTDYVFGSESSTTLPRVFDGFCVRDVVKWEKNKS